MMYIFIREMKKEIWHTERGCEERQRSEWCTTSQEVSDAIRSWNKQGLVITRASKGRSVQSLGCVQLFVTPWTATRQASLSISNSRSSLKLRSIESVMPSRHLILCRPLLLPPIQSLPMSQLFAWGGQSTGASALALFLPQKSQGRPPSEWTGWISLQSKGLSRVFSNTTVQKHQFFSAQPSSQSNSHIHTW